MFNENRKLAQGKAHKKAKQQTLTPVVQVDKVPTSKAKAAAKKEDGPKENGEKIKAKGEPKVSQEDKIKIIQAN
jgi:hypothetical protein